MWLLQMVCQISYRYLEPFMSYLALKCWKSDTHAHTHPSGRQLKITFLDVLDYSEYLDTNIRKNIYDGTLIKNLLDLWYLVWSLTSCASKSTSIRHWSTLYIIYSVIELKTWRVFSYRKLSVDCESCLRSQNINSIWRSKGRRATSFKILDADF